MRTSPGEDAVIAAEPLNGPFQNEAIVAAGRIVTDPPARAGGLGMGPDPFQRLAAALDACAAQTPAVRIRHAPLHRASGGPAPWAALD